jgi:hypothetical protein
MLKKNRKNYRLPEKGIDLEMDVIYEIFSGHSSDYTRYD